MQHMHLPSEIPAIILPSCTLLPHGMLPLYIFEERYRLMLDFCLEHDRMFSIAMRFDDSNDPDNEFDNIAPHATAGMIRACVRNPDGTSHLLLQGLHRHRVTGWQKNSPFPIANVEWLETSNNSHPDIPILASQLTTTTRKLAGNNMCEQMEEHINSLDDPETLGDIVAYNFIRDPHLLQTILAEQNLLLRLNTILSEMQRLHRSQQENP